MSEFAMEPLVRNAWYSAPGPTNWTRGPSPAGSWARIWSSSGAATAPPRRSKTGAATGGVKLSLGKAVETGIQCGYHGMVFDGSGACVDNPGEKLSPAHRVRAYAVAERQNFVWIWTGDPELADESRIIDFPYHDQTGEYNFHYGRYDIAANYMFMMDNLMDLTHLGYVHGTTIGGNPEEHDEAEMTTTRTENGAISIAPCRIPRRRRHSGKPPDSRGRSTVGWISNMSRRQPCCSGPAFTMPEPAVRDPIKPGGLVLRVFHHATPADDANFHYFFSTAVRGEPYDGKGNTGFHEDVLEASRKTSSLSRPSRRRSAPIRTAS